MPQKRDIVVSGKRKRAVARATIKEGEGKIRINKRPFEIFDEIHQIVLKEPLELAKPILKDKLHTINIEVNVKGGGKESQVEASRLAIAKALVNYFKSNELKKIFYSYDKHLLVADTRRKEMRKPRDSKARAKRQKSYR